MTTPEGTDLVPLAELASTLPAPVQTSLIKALSNIFGGIVAIPAAWIKRPAQAVEDTTLARSTVTAILAKAVAEKAIKDPLLMEAATELYLPPSIQRTANRIAVGLRAVEYAAEEANDSTQAAPPDDDWMNRFMRFAEDASSERIQDLFGRILAGEIFRPGSFSMATLRAVSELDQSIAKDFSWAWEKSIDGCLDYDPELQRGEGFTRWKRLSEAGLIAPTSITQYLPPYQPHLGDNSLWSPMCVEDAWILVHFTQSSTTNWPHLEFTRVGKQLGALLPRPDYVENMRRAAQRIRTVGLSRIELHRRGMLPEVIWERSAS
ncbi:DUF2806 domain-containing protein [Ancylobacter polymorphus]|uniref:DUF2806 domain-containing protein n=1 Tax=Ancylobacter polymorphus TaxID=223390 RepID=A0A9E6ZY58_9HYPH|nr:DUF2806 domain-containing protein [Ancylobacter polymorphus]UOK70815.1 DUF2806 domain-containing protein [Ancylobacter polymorphus]